MIIKLTNYGNHKPVLINTNHIVAVHEDVEDDDQTTIILSPESVGDFTVTETVEEIEAIILAASAPA